MNWLPREFKVLAIKKLANNSKIEKLQNKSHTKIYEFTVNSKAKDMEDISMQNPKNNNIILVDHAEMNKKNRK